MSDVRKYLANLINETRNGNVNLSLAGRLGYLLNILKGIIETGDIEERILKLEKEENYK